MAKDFLLASSKGVFGDSVPAGATRYSYPIGYISGSPAFGALNAHTFRDTYTAFNLWINVPVNTVVGNSVESTIKNGVAGNSTITVPGLTTGHFQDITHSESFVAGDTFYHKRVAGAGGGAIEVHGICMQLQHASAYPTILGQEGGLMPAQGITVYTSILGFDSSNATEAYATYTVRVNGVLSFMCNYVYDNYLDNPSTVTCRVNGVDGNQVVTLPANTTGLFVDTTHTDSVSAGQTISRKIITGAGLPGDVIYLGDDTSFVWTSAGQLIGGAYCFTSDNITFGRTSIMGIASDIYYVGNPIYETDALTNVKALFPFILKNLFVYVRSFSLNANPTMGLRINGVTSSLVVVVNGTGAFEDTTHAIGIVATDLINTIVDTSGAASGKAGVSYIGYELDQPSPGGWQGKISGVTNPARVAGVAAANIAKVKGVASA